LQKKHITGLKRLRLAGSVQIEFLWAALEIQLLLSPMFNAIITHDFWAKKKEKFIYFPTKD
jgi:capsular polysaccharide biosynthesis protein